MIRALMMLLVLVVAFTMPLAAGNPSSINHGQQRPLCATEMRGFYTQGQPIDVRFTLENETTEPQVVDLGFDREGGIELKLKRDEGEWIALPRKKEREGIALIGKVTIQPQESYSQQLILDDWYRFSEPGSYVVSLALGKSRRCLGLNFEFKIMPMDADWLSDVSTELLEAIKENKTNYGKAADAAKVLARIDNRLAVPFLVKAHEANPMVDSILIPGLERIGDKEAVHALISLLEKSDSVSLRDELVRPALVRLEKRSAFEEAEKIRIALARFPAP